MTKQELKNMLENRVNELDYSFERFINGSTEFIVYPTMARGNRTLEIIEGPPMRYRFNDKGGAI